jgi:hypothetical protein
VGVGEENNRGVMVGIAVFDLAITSCVVDVDMTLLQEVKITVIKNERTIILPVIFIFPLPVLFNQTPNGLRYLRVGGRGFCLGAGKTRSQKNA